MRMYMDVNTKYNYTHSIVMRVKLSGVLCQILGV